MAASIAFAISASVKRTVQLQMLTGSRAVAMCVGLWMSGAGF